MPTTAYQPPESLPFKAWRRIKRFYWTLITDSSPRVLAYAMALRLGRRTQRNPEPGPIAVEQGRAPRREPSRVDPAVVTPVVFQTWKTRDRLPLNYAVWSATFTRHNPGFEHLIWDDADNRDFMQAEFPRLIELYDRYPREIFRADIVRLFFLYRYGGLYADMDTECLQPVASTLDGHDVVLGRMGHDLAFEHSVPNAMMASRPGQLFWLLAIAIAFERAMALDAEQIRTAKPEALTGPILIWAAVERYQRLTEAEVRTQVATVLGDRIDGSRAVAGRLTILGEGIWYPVDWTNSVHRLLRSSLDRRKIILTQAEACELFPKAVLATYWSHSW